VAVPANHVIYPCNDPVVVDGDILVRGKQPLKTVSVVEGLLVMAVHLGFVALGKKEESSEIGCTKKEMNECGTVIFLAMLDEIEEKSVPVPNTRIESRFGAGAWDKLGMEPCHHCPESKHQGTGTAQKFTDALTMDALMSLIVNAAEKCFGVPIKTIFFPMRDKVSKKVILTANGQLAKLCGTDFLRSVSTHVLANLICKLRDTDPLKRDLTLLLRQAQSCKELHALATRHLCAENCRPKFHRSCCLDGHMVHGVKAENELDFALHHLAWNAASKAATATEIALHEAAGVDDWAAASDEAIKEVQDHDDFEDTITNAALGAFKVAMTTLANWRSDDADADPEEVW